MPRETGGCILGPTMQAELPVTVIRFCRNLRRRGACVGLGEEKDALRALTLIPVSDPRIFRAGLRAVLAKSRPEQRIFDREFGASFPSEKNEEGPSDGEGGRGSEANREPGDPVLSVHRIQQWLAGGCNREESVDSALYSPCDSGARRDYGRIDPRNQAEILAAARAIARILQMRRKGRRWKIAQRGRTDLRRTLRMNLRRGGELVDLARRERKRKKPRVVMLLDTSRSMNPYHSFLVHVMIALSRAVPDFRVFLFSTTLRNATREVRELELGSTWRSARDAGQVWQSGTRIGLCLNEFLAGDGRSWIGRDTAVLVVSDGWDTGDIKLLERSMGEIRRRAALVIWLNPLLASPSYEPRCAGMVAALPHVDIFAPCHDVGSLRRLARALKALARER